MTQQTDTVRGGIVQTIVFWGAYALLIGLYLFEIAAAFGNWQGMAQIAAALSDGLSVTGIVWLAVGVAVPIGALAVAVIVPRKASRGRKLLVLVLGLSLVALCKLNIFYLVPTTSYLSDLSI